MTQIQALQRIIEQLDELSQFMGVSVSKSATPREVVFLSFNDEFKGNPIEFNILENGKLEPKKVNIFSRVNSSYIERLKEHGERRLKNKGGLIDG